MKVVHAAYIRLYRTKDTRGTRLAGLVRVRVHVGARDKCIACLCVRRTNTHKRAPLVFSPLQMLQRAPWNWVNNRGTILRGRRFSFSYDADAPFFGKISDEDEALESLFQLRHLATSEARCNNNSRMKIRSYWHPFESIPKHFLIGRYIRMQIPVRLTLHSNCYFSINFTYTCVYFNRELHIRTSFEIFLCKFLNIILHCTLPRLFPLYVLGHWMYTV